MIENERPLLFSVTLHTEFAKAFVRVEGTHFASMNLVAGTASHLAFSNRMPGRHHHRSRNILVTPLTKL